MGETRERENFIPLRKGELIDWLCEEEGLTPPEVEGFRRLCRLGSATCHFEYHQRMEKLKAAYAPFDPDCDTQSLVRLTPDEHLRRLNDLFRDFTWLMEHAQYRHLTRKEIEPALAAASEWGLRMDVD